MNARFTLYCHTNRVNGKRYVGQTTDTMGGRWKEHVSAAKQHRGARLLGAAIRKYGSDVFDHEVLEVIVATQQEADITEAEWIKRKESRAPTGYNLTAGGGSNGLHHEDSKRLIAASVKKRLEAMTPEQRTSLFQKNIRVWTPERLARQLARSKSREIRENMATGQTNFWSQFTPEEKSARVRHQLAGMSPMEKGERTRKAWANLTPEARAKRVRNAREGSIRSLSPERSKKSSEFQLARQATLTTEQKRAIAAKTRATRQARYGALGMKRAKTPEDYSESTRRGWANMTPEARAERVRKSQEGIRLASLRKAGLQLNMELVPFVRHRIRRGHSIGLIAVAFGVPKSEVERAVA